MIREEIIAIGSINKIKKPIKPNNDLPVAIRTTSDIIDTIITLLAK